MKITIYTINNCNFCKQEKEYLTSNKLAFEEKNLETNREFLAEMLKLSNNFAGVPFTMIEKDNGEVVPMKGFTKEEFDVVLGFSGQPTVEAPAPVVPPPVPSTISGQAPEIKPVEPVTSSTSSEQVPPVVEPISAPQVEPAPVVPPPVVETPVVPVVPPPVPSTISGQAPEIKPVEPVTSSTSSEQVPPVVEPISAPQVEPAPVVPPPVVETPVAPVAPAAATVDPNDELKKVIDSLGAMTNEQKPPSPAGMPSIPDFPANK